MSWSWWWDVGPVAVSSYTCSRLVVPRWGAVPPSGSKTQQKQSVKALQMAWWCRSWSIIGHLHHLQDSHRWEYWCCFVAVGARPLEHHCSYDSSRKSPCTSGMTPCCIPKHDWLHVGKHSLIVTPYCLLMRKDNSKLGVVRNWLVRNPALEFGGRRDIYIEK